MKERTYSKDIANAINELLTEEDWHFSFDEKRGLFKFGLSLNSRIKNVNYIIKVKNDEYMVYVICPLGVDEDDEKMKAEMAEFVCRANYGLKNGNFEFDMGDGEIRYKSYVDCEGVTPAVEVVRNSIHCPAAMFERYGNGITDIIFGNTSAKDAIEKCENALDEELRTLLGEAVDGEGDVDSMLARLAARLGIDEKDLRGNGEHSESEPSETEVKTDLFTAKGGAA